MTTTRINPTRATHYRHANLEVGARGHVTGRAKEVLPAAATDGFTAARNMTSRDHPSSPAIPRSLQQFWQSYGYLRRTQAVVLSVLAPKLRVLHSAKLNTAHGEAMRATGRGYYVTRRQKQEVFGAAAMDGFTAARKVTATPGLPYSNRSART